MELDEYANAQMVMTCNAEQWAAVTAVLTDWKETHENDPEAQQVIEVLKSTTWVRTR